MARYLTWAVLGTCGIAAFAIALGFGHGSGPRIGSAAFPLAISGGIVLVSAWGLVAAIAGGGEEEATALRPRPLLAITAAILFFILTIDRFGILPATVGSMIVAYLGQTERRYAGFLIYAVLFAGAVWLVFTVGLGLPVGAFGGR
jgi:hypothetical protein